MDTVQKPNETLNFLYHILYLLTSSSRFCQRYDNILSIYPNIYRPYLHPNHYFFKSAPQSAVTNS